jgi:hypothetical protein
VHRAGLLGGCDDQGIPERHVCQICDVGSPLNRVRCRGSRIERPELRIRQDSVDPSQLDRCISRNTAAAGLIDILDGGRHFETALRHCDQGCLNEAW